MGSAIHQSRLTTSVDFEPQQAAVRPWVARFERLGRPGMAGLGAMAGSLTSLVLPGALLLMAGGEICPGYKTDVMGYYLKRTVSAIHARPALRQSVIGTWWAGSRTRPERVCSSFVVSEATLVYVDLSGASLRKTYAVRRPG